MLRNLDFRMTRVGTAYRDFHLVKMAPVLHLCVLKFSDMGAGTPALDDQILEQLVACALEIL